MELEEIQSDLFALRQLYSLLQTNGDDDVAFQNAGKLLDKRARQLLKNLLDYATQRISRTHSKIIAAHFSVSNTSFNSYPQQTKVVQKLKPPLIPRKLKVFPISTQNSGKDSERHTITLQNEEKKPNKKLEGEVLELSKLCNSCRKPESTKKHCQICGESSLQKQASSKESKLFNEKARIPSKNGCQDRLLDQQANGLVERNENAAKLVKGSEKPRQKRSCEMVGNSSIAGSVGCSSTCFSTSAGKPTSASFGLTGQIGENKFSKEVSDSINQIESEILAIQLLDPASIGASHPALIKKGHEGGGSVGGGNETLFRQASQSTQKYENSSPARKVPCKCGKPAFVGNNSFKGRFPVMDTTSKQLVKSNDMVNQSASQMDKSGKAAGLKFKRRNLPNPRTTNPLLEPDVKAMAERIESLSRSESQNNDMTSYVHGLRVSLSGDNPGLSPASHKKMHNQTPRESPIQNTCSFKGTTKKAVKSIPLLPPQSAVSTTTNVGSNHKLKPASIQGTNRKGKNSKCRMIIRPTLLEQESSNVMNRIASVNVMTSSSSLPSSSSSSWTTQQNTQVDHDGISRSNSSFEESSSFSNHKQSRRRDVSPTKTFMSRRRKDSKNASGRFKRFKNKLGLIFHHHHHHHHHHDEGRGNDHSETVYRHNTWKHLKKIFHQTGKHDDIHREVTGGKLRNSAVIHNKHRDGHVHHALVEGLFRHLRRSKKLDRHRGGIGGGRGKGPIGGRKKKVVKRFHWLHSKFRNHGGVKKLPNRKGRVKVGFVANKRPKIKMN